MPLAEWLGFIAGALVTVGFLPQIIRVYKLRSAYEISLIFAIMPLRSYLLGRLRDLFRAARGHPVELNCGRSRLCPTICQAKV